MISVINKFNDQNLNIEFSGEDIESKDIIISVENDVNFKPLVDYLIQIIPNKNSLDSTFENFEDEENSDKLNLIKETVDEIYKEFNSSIKKLEDDVEETITDEPEYEQSNEDDDLPF